MSSALNGKRTTRKDKELLFDLLESRTVYISYNSTDPKLGLSCIKDPDHYKMYIADTGLLVTLMFINQPSVDNILYTVLLSDQLPANLSYLYENAVAQMIASTDRKLFYHTWKKDQTHYYELTFLQQIKEN